MCGGAHEVRQPVVPAVATPAPPTTPERRPVSRRRRSVFSMASEDPLGGGGVTPIATAKPTLGS
jgi:hypothetical protein